MDPSLHDRSASVPLSEPRLSIVIICWNDGAVLRHCLRSIYDGTRRISFEIIISDNGSTDGSPELLRQQFPDVRVLENRANLGFARGNNVGICQARGQYVLILNPDTVIHGGALDTLVDFAERHPEGGAFGCRVVNPDGSYQISARRFPTLRRYWMAALGLRRFEQQLSLFTFEQYQGWYGDSERPVDWQSGCCVMFRSGPLRQLGGFDEQFFYHFEEVDLCRRLHDLGLQTIFTPAATITHLGGQSVNRFPIRFQIEKHRSRYKYFHKHFGARASRQCRWLSITWIRVRQLRCAIRRMASWHNQAAREEMEMYRAVARWNVHLDPIRFVQYGEEPRLE